MNVHQPNEFQYRIAILDMLVKRKEQIEAALEHGREGHSFSDVFELVASNRGMFFWNENSSAVLEWRQYPSGPTIHVLWAGGDYEALLDLYKVVAEFAKKSGAKRMTTLGRDGFRKRLPSEGWEIEGTWFSKEIV